MSKGTRMTIRLGDELERRIQDQTARMAAVAAQVGLEAPTPSEVVRRLLDEILGQKEATFGKREDTTDDTNV